MNSGIPLRPPCRSLMLTCLETAGQTLLVRSLTGRWPAAVGETSDGDAAPKGSSGATRGGMGPHELRRNWMVTSHVKQTCTNALFASFAPLRETLSSCFIRRRGSRLEALELSRSALGSFLCESSEYEKGKSQNLTQRRKGRKGISKFANAMPPRDSVR